MTNCIDPQRAGFFQALSQSAPLRCASIEYYDIPWLGSGYKLWSENGTICQWLLRLFLRPFCNTDQKKHIAEIRQFATRRLNEANEAEELSAIAKSAHTLKSLAKSVKDVELKGQYRTIRTEAIFKASQVSQKSPYLIALEIGQPKEASKHIPLRRLTEEEQRQTLPHANALLKWQEGRGNLSYILELISLDADPSLITISLDDLLQAAFQERHIGASLALSRKFSSQVLLERIQAATKNDPQESCEFLFFCLRFLHYAQEHRELLSPLFEKLIATLTPEISAKLFLVPLPFRELQTFFLDRLWHLRRDKKHVTYCKAISLIRHGLKLGSKNDPEVAEFRKMLKAPLNAIIPLAANSLNVSPFQFACEHGFYDFAVNNYASSIKLSLFNAHHEPLLRHAAKRKLDILVLHLIYLGADFSKLALDKNQLLITSLRNSEWNFELTSCRLIEQGADVNQTFDTAEDKKVSLLHEAVSKNQKMLAQLLIQKGVNVNVQDDAGNTPLHLACKKLDSEMIHWLLERGANPSIKNKKRKTPSDLIFGNDEPLKDQQKTCLRELFCDCEVFCQILDGAPSYSKLSSTLCEQAERLVTDLPPFQLMLFLQDSPLAESIAELYTKETYFKEVENFTKRFPLVDVSFLEAAPYGITLAHLQRGQLDDKVEVPKQNVSLHRLLDFLEILPESDRARTQASLQEMIRKVEAKEAFLGTPRQGSAALKEYYLTIQHALQNIIIKLHELKKQKSAQLPFFAKEVLTELKRASGFCGGQYLTQPVLLYLKVCKGIIFSKEDKIFRILAECRGLLAEGLFGNDRQGVHSFNNFMRKKGKALGLPGHKMIASFDDQYAGDFMDADNLEDEFINLYLMKIRDLILPRILDSELRDEYVDWHKDHVPTTFRQDHFDGLIQKVNKCKTRQEQVALLKEHEIELQPEQNPEIAIREEQISTYLSEVVYDMNTGKPRPVALIDMLLGIGVLYSVFEEDKAPKAYVKAVINSGWLHRFTNYLSSFIPQSGKR